MSSQEPGSTAHQGNARDVELGRTFVRLADSLVSGFDVADLLTDLAKACVSRLGAAAAGLLLADAQNELRVMAGSSDDSDLLDLFRLTARHGPAAECFASGRLVAAAHEAEQARRWPQLAMQLRARGCGAIYALPLRLRAESLGVLILLRRSDDPLSQGDLDVAQALADVATISITQHRVIQAGQELTAQLQTALNSRVAIEQAKGLIAAHAGVDMNRAFEMLRTYARRSHARLSVLAAEVAAGRFPVAQVIAAADPR